MVARICKGAAVTRMVLLGVAAVALLLASAGEARAAFPGSLDPSFGSGGIASSGPNSRLFGTAVQKDGKVLTVGEVGVQSGTTLLLTRFTSGGSLDPSFGAGGIVKGPSIPGFQGGGSLGRGVAVQPDGKIVVVGTATTSVGTGHLGLVVERYNPNGSLDQSFGSGGLVTAFAGQASGDGYALAIQPDGKIIAGGSAEGGDQIPRVGVARLNPNGSFDSSFALDGIDILDLGAYSYALAVALQPDGKILLAGSQAPGQLAPSALIARLQPLGGLDPSFAGTGWYANQYAQGGAAGSAFNALALQGDGKIVAAGTALHGASGADTLAVRFSAAGAPDGSFGSGGVAYTESAVYWSESTPTVPGAYGVVVAPTGEIVTSGFFANGNAEYATLWALTPGGSLDSAFGQHGAAVLTNSFGDNTQYSALALSPANTGFLAAGEAVPPSNGASVGIAARYVGFGFGTPPPPELRGVRGNYRTSTVVKHGLRVTVAYNAACTIKVLLEVSAATARKLHLKLHAASDHVTIATGSGALSSSGTRSITLRLSRGTGSALQRQRRVSLTLVVSVTSSATGKTATLKRKITLTR